MSILCNRQTKLLVQGITGSEGTFHTAQMIAYGTNVVGGVTPGKGGTRYSGKNNDRFDHDVPVFNTVREAVAATKADATCIFVPAPMAADAILEAIEAEVPRVCEHKCRASLGIAACITPFRSTRPRGARRSSRPREYE